MKKVLSLVLALAMVLGSFSFVSAASYDDVEGTVYSDAVERLSLLSILQGYPDGTFKPEETITRAEFAAVAVRAKGLENAANASKGLATGFTDVDATHWASGYVGTAGKLGIVNGVGNGLFAPAAPVKYEEAITMVVRALGYEASAQTKGGYPYGYLIVANEIGLLDDVKGTQGAPASRGTVAQIADNALEIPMMIQVGFGVDAKWVVSGSKEHGDEAEEQYLLDAMGFSKFEGRVQFDDDFDDEITLVDEEERNSSIKLDVAEGFDFYEVEGVTITVWYNDDDLVISYTIEDEILFDAVEYEDDDEITLVGADKDYDLSDDMELYLDREELDYEDDFENQEADFAKVVLNDDGDVIFVDAYDFDGFIVVEEVDDEEIISLNDDELDAEDFLIVKEGKTISAEDLEEQDIVFYNESEEFAVVYNNSVVGEIDRVYSDDSFRLSGKTYDPALDSLYLDEGEMDELDGEVLEGMMDEESEVEIFFDFKGDVVLVVGVSGTTVVDDYAVPTDPVRAFSGRKGLMVAFDVLNSAGEKVSYDLEADDLNNDDIDNNLRDFDNDGDEIDQGDQVLFEIATDKDGDVTELMLLTSDLIDFGDETFEIDDKYAEANDGKDYRLKSSTVVFYDWDGREYDEVVTLGEAEDVFSEVEEGYLYVVDGEVEVVLAKVTDADTDTTDYTGLVTDVYVTRDDVIQFTIEVAGTEMEFDTEDDQTQAEIDRANDLLLKVATLEVGDTSNEVEDFDEAAPKSVVTITSLNTARRTINSYELTRDAKIYEIDGDDYDGLVLRDLEVGDEITVYFEEKSPRFVNYVLIGASEEGEVEGEEDTTTYIVKAYNDTFGRFTLENRAGEEVTMFVEDFDGYVIGEDEVSEPVMTAWLADEDNVLVNKTIEVTEDNVLVVEGEITEEVLITAIEDAKAGDTIIIPSGNYDIDTISITEPISIIGEDGTKINGVIAVESDGKKGTTLFKNLEFTTVSKPIHIGTEDGQILDEIVIDGVVFAGHETTKYRTISSSADFKDLVINKLTIKNSEFGTSLGIYLTGDIGTLDISDNEFIVPLTHWGSDYAAVNINQGIDASDSINPSGTYTVSNNRVIVPTGATAEQLTGVITNQGFAGVTEGKELVTSGNTLEITGGTPINEDFIKDIFKK